MVRGKIVAGCALLVAGALLSCSEPKPKTDAELGLTTQQAAGRRVYNADCLVCHAAYSNSGKNGPSLQGLFKKQYMRSGIPATDGRVRDVILIGRPMMPGFRNALSQQEVDELLAYLHTL